MFAEVLQQLDTIADISSTASKKLRVTRYLMASAFFERVLVLALDSRYHFHINKLPEPGYDIFSTPEPMTPDEILDYLEALAQQSGASHADKQKLADVANSFQGGLEIVSRIVKKDLRCGVGVKLVNSAKSGLLFEWPYMRCRSYTEKNMQNIKEFAIAQEKADGAHVDVVFDGHDVSFHSRTGKPLNFLGALDESALALFDDCQPGVFIGEAIAVDDDGNVLPRKTGNGLIAKANKGTITNYEAEQIRLVLWEYVALDVFFQNDDSGQLPYDASFRKVLVACDSSDKCDPINFQYVSSQEDIVAFYRAVKKSGGEGLVVKNLDGHFKSTNSGSKDQVKVKALDGEEYEAEFRITDFNFGKAGTRFEKGLGSLAYVSEDGLIFGNVGSGFSHHERDSLTYDDVIGRVVTLRFDELITDKADGALRLYAPRFIEFREDKDAVDTTKYVKELSHYVD